MPASRGRVGVVGLGYVGLPLVAAFASVGYEVTGLDIDAARVNSLRDGGPIPVFEPGVEEVLRSRADRIAFTDSYAELIERADTLFVTVGTPLLEGSGADLSALNSVIDGVAGNMRAGLTIVLKSTVPPGTTRQAASTLEERTGMRHGRDFWMAYSPERTVEGRALEELLSLVSIVGGLDSQAATRVEKVVAPLGGRVVVVPTPEIAEMCKLVDNAYRAVNIAFSNEVGQICQALGFDSDILRAAVSEGHPRTQLFHAGLGAAGPCLSKDPPTLLLSAQALGVDAPVLGASVQGNVDATAHVAQKIVDFVAGLDVAEPKVALLGLAFKGRPATDDTRGGPAELIYSMLADRFGGKVRFGLHDPLVYEFHSEWTTDIAQAIKGAHAIAILTDHPALHGLRSDDLLRGSARPLLVVDAWHGVSDPGTLAVTEGVRLVRIGDGSVAAG